MSHQPAAPAGVEAAGPTAGATVSLPGGEANDNDRVVDGDGSGRHRHGRPLRRWDDEVGRHRWGRDGTAMGGSTTGTPLHAALLNVRWKRDGSGVRCSGLGLVERLVDDDGGGSRGEGEMGMAGVDGEKDEATGTEKSSVAPSAPQAVPLVVASRIRDNRGRTPLQIWVRNIFPRLMNLPGLVTISADAETISARQDDFSRCMVILRKLLVAWPGACSVLNHNGETILVRVLRWELRGWPWSLCPVMPLREEVERRHLEVVRILATCGSYSRFGCPILHYAVECNRSSGFVGAILEASSSYSSSSKTTTTTPLPLRRNNVMEVPLHVAATLRAPLSVIGVLLWRRHNDGGCSSPSEQATAVDSDGRTPLTWAYIRFLEHYHGLITSRKNKNGGGTDPEVQGGEAVATVPDYPNAMLREQRRAQRRALRRNVPRDLKAPRRNVPRDLKNMEDEVLRSLRQCSNREELLSELGSFWDVAQLLLISAYHCGRSRRGIRANASSGGNAADAGETAAAAVLATDPGTMSDDVRSFLGEDASGPLIEQVQGVLTPRDIRGEKWRIVHAAASLCPGCCPRGVLEIAIMVQPDQLREMDRGGRLPLHLAIDAWCRDNVYNHQRTGTAAAAASEDDGEVRTCRLTRDEVGPSAVCTVLSAFPEAAGVPDGSSRRMPLHVAVAGLLRSLGPPSSLLAGGTSKSTTAAGEGTVGSSFRRDVRRIVMAHPEALGQGDAAPGPDRCAATRGLLPFMIAAAGSRGMLCLSYELLREGPEAVIGGIIPSESEVTETKRDGEASCGTPSAWPDIGGVVSSSSGSPAPPIPTGPPAMDAETGIVERPLRNEHTGHDSTWGCKVGGL